jgi:uncharacterized protein (DUF2236 family)
MSTPIMPSAADWPSLTPHPGTITWRRTSDARVLIAAGYALLLQVAHPTVGAGVSEHSQFQRDPWGRLLRTLDYTYTMVYGGPQAAGEMGRRIHSFHKQINGKRRDELEALARPAAPELPVPCRPLWPVARVQLGHFLGLSTVGLLPPVLRWRFGLSWTRANELELRVLSTALHAATPLMPSSLRNAGPGYLRWRREAITRGDVAAPASTPARRR